MSLNFWGTFTKCLNSGRPTWNWPEVIKLLMLRSFSLATPDPYTKIEEHKGYSILQYGMEDGYRVDFGTKRSIELPTVDAAKQLIDNTN
ncbi:hypothetical protein NST83_12705 [Paenibacillus sp. FSL R10-2782]|uniref:hypothetical protein n=1 Tax=Paenibacillus sp. FSL R10-2782 TaxID=2954661 RepID=UPI003158908B